VVPGRERRAATGNESGATPVACARRLALSVRALGPDGEGVAPDLAGILPRPGGAGCSPGPPDMSRRRPAAGALPRSPVAEAGPWPPWTPVPPSGPWPSWTPVPPFGPRPRRLHPGPRRRSFAVGPRGKGSAPAAGALLPAPGPQES